MIVLKIIQYFRRFINVLEQLVVMLVIFDHGNLKNCLMKILSFLLHLKKKKMLNPSVKYVGTKARVTFKGDCLKQDKK